MMYGMQMIFFRGCVGGRTSRICPRVSIFSRTRLSLRQDTMINAKIWDFLNWKKVKIYRFSLIPSFD